MSSWRQSTKRQYYGYIARWLHFSSQRQIDPMQTDAAQVLAFLTSLFEHGLGYSSLNVARSAIASFVVLKDGASVGCHPMITRFLKGVFTLRPPAPRYNRIWDVKLVFDVLRKWAPAPTLDLKYLTLKLVMLVALVSAQRGQTLHKLRLDHMYCKGSTFFFEISDLIKQSRPGHTGLTVALKAYPADRRLCVFTYLKLYLSRTEQLRRQTGGTTNQLFISFKKPHAAVSKDTIARWINMVLSHAGVDIGHFKPHSTRAASTSAASRLGVPLPDILRTAGWSNEATFQRYYNKPLVCHTNNMADTLLEHS